MNEHVGNIFPLTPKGYTPMLYRSASVFFPLNRKMYVWHLRYRKYQHASTGR